MRKSNAKPGTRAVPEVSEETLEKVSGGATGSFSDLSSTTGVNKSSPKLSEHLSRGKVF